MKLSTYLSYGGNCEEALRFYEKHLGARIDSLRHFKDMPGAKSIPPGQENYVMHAHLVLGGATVMASDLPPEQFQPMRSVYLTLDLESVEEVDRIAAILGEGAEIVMPLQNTFFANRFTMLKDRFGTSWMLIN
ncbi:VOC family protein [Silvibacterium acidisoli]|uniref:VOC family protein n=1 Tax=Acidobacteriaceae bacterium ZG23-2 TaxID=2883246 RepID=UPI00406C638B